MHKSSNLVSLVLHSAKLRFHPMLKIIYYRLEKFTEEQGLFCDQYYRPGNRYGGRYSDCALDLG